MLTDDRLQRELSAAFHSEADPVVRLASPPDALLERAARFRRRRVAVRAGTLIAAAAAAAAVVVAAGVLSPAPGRAPAAVPATRATQPPPAGRYQTTPAASSTASGGPASALLAAKVAKAPTAVAAASGMPSFYAVADRARPDIEIRDSASGNLLSTVPLPGAIEPKLTLVTASGDERTFVLALFSLSGGTRFYELKLTVGGQASALAALPVHPVPAGEGVHNIALTPDGARLAVVVQKTGMQGANPVVEQEAIEVIDLATGAARTWTTAGDGLLTDLTWDAQGRQLAYFYVGDTPRTSGLWRLDTGAPGRALLSGRRLLPQIVGPDQVEDALLAPDGRHIIASVILSSLSDVTDNTVVGGIVQVDAQTGRPLQTLLAQHPTASGPSDVTVSPCELQSVDPTGDHLLVNCAESFGRLDRARFTALAGAGNLSPTASAW
jgi:hypothetical protein